MKNKLMELMAPAGSYEAIAAAINAGADSIYFGVEQLNMRTKSTHNFTLDDLPKISEICKSNQVKSYLTLNTIVYDHDIQLLKRIIDSTKAAGITAIIASDHAVMNYCRKAGVPVHISTQANITNIDTVEFYSVYADVMVMARELSLQQVQSIHREIQRREITGPSGELVKLEVFGHGALCMAVSGKCYLSLHSNYSSANRGACIQNCRKSYIVTDKEDGVEFEVDNEYIMSAKDLCTIDFLDKIVGAGVSVLKVEGRGRSADYVHVTIQCYREAIDALANGTYSKEKIDQWKERLSTVFNRGFWDGYYLGRKMGEWNDEAGSKATKRKVYIGKGLKYYDQAGVAEFLIEAQGCKVGDELLIIGPTTGVVEASLHEMRCDDQSVDIVKRGKTITFPVSTKIRPSDKLYKLVPAT
ncbi:MAG: U32 family peptidase [Bacteroidia bacterium]|nr:U32 family peptidase [Bacteroidia bacterium]MCZ2247804.1 U32 family peptidase [Bacteroidia bacterium]